MSDKRQLLYFASAKWVPFFLIALMTLLNAGAKAMGERYTVQGGRLGAAINEMLIDKGFCKSARDCNDFLPGYVGHGDRVRFAFYEVSEQNGQAFSAIVGLVIKDGIRNIGGVPITMSGYRETYEKVRESGLVIKKIKPFANIEVNK